MKTYHKGHPGNIYLYRGFEYIVYNTGRKSDKFHVHFVTEGPHTSTEIPMQRRATFARKLAEQAIDQTQPKDPE